MCSFTRHHNSVGPLRPSPRIGWRALCLGMGVGLALLGTGSPAAAASPESGTAASPAAETLHELLDRARTHNPSLRAARARWQSARQRILQAWALPDPSVSYMVMGSELETRLGPQSQVYGAEQMVPFPGKLWEKRKMAQAEASAAEAAFRGVERDVLRDVTTTYDDLFTTEASIRVLEDIQDVLKRFESVSQARYATKGGEGQRDVAKAQVEVSMTLERLLLLRQQRESLAARMAALLDESDAAPFDGLVQPAKPVLRYDLPELLRMASETRPELRSAASMLQRDRHAKRLAMLEYVPDVSVGFQYVTIGNGTTTNPDDGRDAWMVPLKVTIPLWQNRIVPAIKEARRNFSASQAAFDETRNLTDYDVRDLYYRYTASAKVVELYENALMPEAEMAFTSDQAGYEAGRQDALNLLDSERVYLNAKLAYYQALGETLKSFAELERAVGRALE